MSRLSDADHAVQQIDEFGTMIGISRQWYEEAKAKLAEYEILEEQGRLVRLPCKVGTPYFKVFSLPEFNILPGISYLIFSNVADIVSEFDNFGKTVFLSREEAEAALKGDE